MKSENSIGNRIKEIRTSHNMTQKEFGSRLGMNQHSISAYEKGIRQPSNPMVLSICREFDINEEWLRYGCGEKLLANVKKGLSLLTKEYGLTQEERALIETFVSFDKNGRKQIIDYLRQITSVFATLEENKNMECSSEIGVDIAAAEAAYEKALHIAPSTSSTALSTTSAVKRNKREA